jgi:hypothetical protein
MQSSRTRTGPEARKSCLCIERAPTFKDYVSLVDRRGSPSRAKAAWTSGEVAHSHRKIAAEVRSMAGLGEEHGCQHHWPAVKSTLSRGHLSETCTCYMDTMTSLVEISPLDRSSKNGVDGADAKFNFDPTRCSAT